jgi:hypothetical protein
MRLLPASLISKSLASCMGENFICPNILPKSDALMALMEAPVSMRHVKGTPQIMAWIVGRLAVGDRAVWRCSTGFDCWI